DQAEEEARIGTVQRFASDFWTPSSADRNILFACQLAMELSDRKTQSEPLRCGEVVSILNLALDRRRRLVETQWNFEPPNSNEVSSAPQPLHAVAYSPDGQTLVIGDSRGRVRVLRGNVL